MAAKFMLKHRQLHLKINQTIFLKFLETIKNLHVLMVYSYANLTYYKKKAKGSIILNMYKQAQIYTEMW